MSSTSENEIVEILERADEKLKLRIRETSAHSINIANVIGNRKALADVRVLVTDAINRLLLIKWD